MAQFTATIMRFSSRGLSRLLPMRRMLYSAPLSSLSQKCTLYSTRNPVSSLSGRSFGSLSDSTKLKKTLTAEIQHEEGNYEQPEGVAKFLKANSWTFEDRDGDINMALTKTLEDGKKVAVDFQLVSPFQAEESENEQQAEMTDFSVTLEGKGNSGVTFYCTTLQNDEKYRYMIGNVRYFADEESRSSVSSFNGPEFEDLDDALQETLDEWLSSLGIDTELCNFIDACSVDKEQREYIHWLKNVSKFIEGN
ncbi:glycoprotein [Cardiosporidium cionae]|uniref:Glycoprotein n=1 Tax=Cardiosporidium cionae TaxID=476202 RepID=A0ABQ7J960_9APIC|nr:glycoprotein [Cardiosporidium cionae]|eukprot:KAF8820469.1 glycoprotein [Cardiosporidium cionae]